MPHPSSNASRFREPSGIGRPGATLPGPPARQRAPRLRLPRALTGLAIALAASACRPVPEAPQTGPGAGEWREFAGSWNASGSRKTMVLGPDRRGSILDLRGTMLLTGPGRPGVGFHAEVIALVDTATGLTGRSVWTDERGDQVYSELQGEGTADRNRIKGTLLGGTGRYAGATGSYEFSWQWVIESDDGSIQGRAIELKGRVRPGPAAAGGVSP